LKKVELESFLKSFILFFVSMGALIGTINYINYMKDVQTLDERVFNEMRICSFDLECAKYKINFVLTKDKELYKLYKTSEALSSYFTIPNSTLNSIEIYYPIEKYNLELHEILKESLISLFFAMLAVLIFSILFSLYTLYPLRNALHLTQEFVKDILHDFNTPLSTLRLNSAMLEREGIKNAKIMRIQKSVQTILNLQENLRAYLNNSALQKEELDLSELVMQRLEILRMNYEHLHLQNRVPKRVFFTNKDAFTRIIDNLLSNAAKYNKEDGTVEVYMQENENVLCIKDNGKGIKNPSKVFDRFYKEQDVGIGIGLHIVKKLSTELGIELKIKTSLNQGTTFYLKLS